LDEEYQLEKTSQQIIDASVFARSCKLEHPISKINVEFIIDRVGLRNGCFVENFLDSKLV